MRRTPFRRVLVAGIAAVFALPGAAAARPGDRTFDQTFPRASALCAAVAGGKTPARYAGNEFAIFEACGSLHAAFDAADAAMDAANSAFDAGVVAAAAARDQACNRPRRPLVCVVARADYRAAVARLRATRLAAVLAYGDALADSRDGFWVAVSTPAEPQPT